MLNKITSQLLVASFVVCGAIGHANAGSFLTNSKYMWDKNEGRWVTKFRIGAAVPFGYEEEWFLNDAPLGFDASPDDEFFDVAVNIEAEINYRFSDHINFATSIGYQPHSRDTWASGLTSESTEGRITLIPITTMVQYHFAPYGQMRPYVGAGYHYTIGRSTYDAIDMDDGHGPALQAGVDWWLEKSWGMNFEVKHMWFETEVDTSPLTTLDLVEKVELNPTIFSIGLMHRF